MDFVSWLVLLESGRQKFAPGVATVGGRIRIAVVTKEGFEEPKEPELEHRLIGFAHDF